MQVADLTERRNLLMAMLDAVYIDIVEEKSVVAIRPKPAFRPIFEVATTRGGSGIILINETPPDPEGPEAESLCSWWRRGRVELYRERGLAVLVAWCQPSHLSQPTRPSALSVTPLGNQIRYKGRPSRYS